jgi:Xaa-Pro aminopeptidase
MMEAMLADGGEEPTLFLWACDRYPFPHPFRLPTTRPMESRDLITCEIHPKTGGYFTHVERTFCLGEPDRESQRIYDGCVAAFRRGMELFGPGKSIAACMGEVKRVIDDAGIASTHSRPIKRRSRPSAANSSRAWSSPSTSTCLIRTGATAKPALYLPIP